MYDNSLGRESPDFSGGMAHPEQQRPNPDTPRDVTAVIVTYNSAEAIGPCLAALPAIPCVVVDNASDDDTCAIVRRLRPDAVLLRNDENLGFGRAVNRGFESVATPYALLLNPDAICTAESLATLRRAFDRSADAGIVVPLLLDAAEKPSLSVMGPREQTHRSAPFRPEAPFCTWFVTAAAWLCSMDAWRQVGGFDPAIFMYGEDVDLCLRMSAAGRAMIVVPEACATHHGGRSSRIDWRVRWRKDWHMTWGHFYIMGKHGEIARARAEARRTLVRHGLKTLLYVLLLNPKRAIGNLARAHAALVFLRA
jgi:N-acetylglucosaminyl-diphospho-decaprenol L-rhamnosyltransferase